MRRSRSAQALSSFVAIGRTVAGGTPGSGRDVEVGGDVFGGEPDEQLAGDPVALRELIGPVGPHVTTATTPATRRTSSRSPLSHIASLAASLRVTGPVAATNP